MALVKDSPILESTSNVRLLTVNCNESIEVKLNVIAAVRFSASEASETADIDVESVKEPELRRRTTGVGLMLLVAAILARA